MRLLAIGLALLVSLGSHALGQSYTQPRTEADSSEWRRLQKQRLNILFETLKNSKSEQQAKFAAAQIWVLWYKSGDVDIDVLMRQARHNLEVGHHGEAIKLVDQALKRAPKYSEAWNLRATILFYMGRHDEAVADIERTLALEPRHFGALSGLTMINMKRRNWSGAAKALRAGLSIHPFMRQRKFLSKLEDLAKGKEL